MFEFWAKDRRRLADYYVSKPEFLVILDWLYPTRDGRPFYAGKPSDGREMLDKGRFFADCNEYGLPTTPILAEFQEGALARWYGPDPGKLPHADLFSKPTRGVNGRGASWWHRGPSGWYRSEGESLGTEQVLRLLAQESAKEPLILQPKLSNHPRMATVSAGGLCTVRVVTVGLPGGNAELVVASLRMPIGLSATDNFAGGGLGSAIDLDTGCLRAAVRKRPDYGYAVYSTHPDTGQAIEGFCVPCWDEVVELCLRGQEAFSQYHSVGWDVAVTEDGPLLLEGNSDWGIDVIQIPHELPIGLTRFAGFYDELAAYRRSCSE
jgi:hypothetical protein